MGFHSFSLDPRTILGVGPIATADEIHEAYRAKSKKHHPDMGGDEWAFRMVTRAYEVLKTTSRSTGDGHAERSAASAWAAARAAEWPGVVNHPFVVEEPKENEAASASTGHPWARSEENTDHNHGDDFSPGCEPAELRTVEIELIWTRFENDRPGVRLEELDGSDSTLSVCLVIAWPSDEFVDQTTQFAGSAVTLRGLIDLFEQLRGEPAVVAGRSRIEDGRFVGWLSYPDVVAAQDAFLKLRETFQTRGLRAKLHTRDERVPYAWAGESQPSVISRAS